ncbi:MAG: non-hydrolyzing UDP-N-acetylglucosamine 2-epimerase [Candidatus Hodarchaeota archaeon]
MKIVTIVGARPQFIKAAPVSRAIKEHNRRGEKPHIVEVLVHTGQHYDNEMSAVFFRDLRIPEPYVNLGVGSGSHGWQTAQMLMHIERVLTAQTPDLVLVYGDTNSTLAGALASAKLQIPVAHIEAGLRSFNRRMPEEINRLLTDHVSTILFCPTNKAVDNLSAEGVVSGFLNQSSQSPQGRRFVHLVGDVMLDAALYYKEFVKEMDFDLPGHFILSTIHRQENTDKPDQLVSIFGAFMKISQEIPIVIPIHPRTRKKLKEFGITVSTPGLHLMEPVSYLEMCYLLEKCVLVMTDSGGLQKEAFFHGKPCITLRDETEWVELVDHGSNALAGTDENDIYEAFRRMRNRKIKCNLGLYGDGKASERIVELLMNKESFS